VQSLRDIRRKIRVVKNIQQITQAMKMVAAAKLRKVQNRVTAGRPYFEKMRDLVEALAPRAREVHHPLLDVREEVHTIGLVVITAEKGLCGSYNANLIRAAVRFLDDQEEGVPAKLLTVGRKGRDFFSKRDYDIHQHFTQIGVDSPYSEVKAIANAVTGFFLDGTVDRVYIAYTQFISAMRQRPLVVPFLPIEPPAGEEDATDIQGADYIYEPEAEELLGRLLPRYVDTLVYHYLLESVASEYGARMTSMSAATDNAGELIESLTLEYNRSRQASITKEILEIAGGAEALKTSG